MNTKSKYTASSLPIAFHVIRIETPLKVLEIFCYSPLGGAVYRHLAAPRFIHWVTLLGGGFCGAPIEATGHVQPGGSFAP